MERPHHCRYCTHSKRQHTKIKKFLGKQKEEKTKHKKKKMKI
jgi:hypothetical protein